MRSLLCAGLLLIAVFGSARADILFYQGNDPEGLQNVLFNTNADVTGPAGTLRGHVQGTPTSICLGGSYCVNVEGVESLIANNTGGGQATITGSDGAFTTAKIYLTDPVATFTKLSFGLAGAGQGQAAQVDFIITVTEKDGSISSATLNTGSGNTRFVIEAVSGQEIRNVDITALGDDAFEMLKQLRMGGFATPPNPPESIPEPASLLLLGTVISATWMLRRTLR